MAEELTLNRIRSSAVREATGKSWEEWLALLDAAGARDADHKAIVAYLRREHPHLSGWWQQSVTVAYEQARGKRVLGETAETGFQMGVRKTLPMSRDDAWRLLVEHPERWLGEGAVSFEKGARYELTGGYGGTVRGQIRVVKPGERLRASWHPEPFEAPATLQVTLTEAKSGTTVGVHVEKLADAQARDGVLEHFREILQRLADGPLRGR